MNQQQIERTTALAGIFQAGKLIADLAQFGQIDDKDFSSSIASILQTDPKDMQSVYGGIDGVKLGIEQLLLATSTKNMNRKIDQQTMRYTISIIMLCKKLQKNPNMMRQIKTRLARVNQQVEHFHLTHDNVLAGLSGLYADTLSTLSYRVKIAGKSEYLQSPRQMDKVRSLLLAGIRSAVLWYQLGGRLYQLLLCKKGYSNTALHLLKDV